MTQIFIPIRDQLEAQKIAHNLGYSIDFWGPKGRYERAEIEGIFLRKRGGGSMYVDFTRASVHDPAYFNARVRADGMPFFIVRMASIFGAINASNNLIEGKTFYGAERIPEVV